MGLSTCLDSWIQIGTPDYVLQWISDGVPIPFQEDTELLPFELDNHSFTQRQADFVSSEIDTTPFKGLY